jgi:hypothetical protein
MYSNQKTEQQATDKMYHIYDHNGVVTHSLSEEDFDRLYDATNQDYEECILDKSSEEHSY